MPMSSALQSRLLSSARDQRIRGVAGLLVASLTLSSCMVGPDFKRPAPPQAKSYAPQPLPEKTVAADVAAGAAQHFDSRKNIPFDWWTLFHSPKINALIEEAFKANSSITAAQAALHAAQENIVAQQGFFWPTVGVNYSPTRNKLAGNMGGNSPGIQGNGQVIQTYSNPVGPVYNGPAYYNFHTAMLTVGYTPDVFGNNRRQVESLQAQADTLQYQLDAAYITLASNIVAAALQEAVLRAQIRSAERIVKINHDLLDILNKQRKLGYASSLDVAAQESATAQAEQSLFPLQNQLELTRDMLRALADNQPDEDIAQTFELSEMQLPEVLPVSLPSDLVNQRPDVRAAEEQMHYASAQVGVARSNRLPQFTLTGDIGGGADTFNRMFHSGAGFFNLIGNVGQTLFDGGTLSARERSARQSLIQAEEQYKSTVITAFQNVADTLHAIESDAKVLKAATANDQAMLQTLNITRKQYETGFASYPMLLAADQNYQQAEMGLIQAQATRFGDTAALYQALGGGWWNRKDDASASSAPLQAMANGSSP